MSDFSENLKLACSTRHSISEVCRNLGINRQQFNRYINGCARPSPFNLRKIAAYFQMLPDDFSLSAQQFRTKISGIFSNSPSHSEFILSFFNAELSNIEQYLGDYQTYHVSPSWPGFIIYSFTRIRQERDWIQVKSIERIYDPVDEVQQRSKYSGLFSMSRNKIFIVEKSHRHPSIIAETILQPFEMHQKKYLKGLTIGVSWKHDNMPYAARTIWRKLNKNTNIKNLIKKCGRYSYDSHELPEPVKKYFAADTMKNDILT